MEICNLHLGLPYPLPIVEKEQEDLPKAQETKLERLFQEGRREEIKALILFGNADVNEKFSNGKTILIKSMENQELPFTEWLLEHKANPNFSYKGQTIFQWASETYQMLPFIKLLLKHGGEIDRATSANPWTPPVIFKFFFPEKEYRRYFPYNPYAEEFVSQKQLAQSFRLATSSTINGVYVDLMPGFSPRWADAAAESLTAMVDRYPHLIPKQEAEILRHFLEKGSYALLPPEEIMSVIEQGVPTMLHSGFINHSVVFSFFKSRGGLYLIIANKGARSRSKPFEILRIDPALLDQRKIKEMQDLRFQPVEQYELWLSRLSQSLRARPSHIQNALKAGYPFGISQFGGFCAWESLETALFVETALVHLEQKIGVEHFDFAQPQHREIIGEAVQIFQHLLLFMKFRTVQNYVLQHQDPSKEFLPINEDLLFRAFFELGASEKSQEMLPYFNELENEFLDKIGDRYKKEYIVRKKMAVSFRMVCTASILMGIFIGAMALRSVWHG